MCMQRHKLCRKSAPFIGASRPISKMAIRPTTSSGPLLPVNEMQKQRCNVLGGVQFRQDGQRRRQAKASSHDRD
jgi:hypothetical protein